MNKRIKKLLEQATTIEVISGRGFDTTQYIERFDEETFAKLIVQECVNLIRKQSIGEEILGGQHFKTVQLGETIATITEHFGVEE